MQRVQKKNEFVMVALNFISLGLTSGEMDIKFAQVEVCLLYCSRNVTEGKSSHGLE